MANNRSGGASDYRFHLIGATIAKRAAAVGLAVGCSGAATGCAPKSRAPLYDAAVSSRLIVAAALEPHAGSSRDESHRVVCRGRVFVEGHFAKPREKHEFQIESTIVAEPAKQLIASEEKSGPADLPLGSTLPDTTRMVVEPNVLFRATNGKVAAGPVTQRQIAAARYELAEVLPGYLLQLALESHSLHQLGDGQLDGAPVDIVVFTAEDGETRALAIDRTTHRLKRTTRLLFGGEDLDPVEETDYEYDVGNFEPKRVRRHRGGEIESDLVCHAAGPAAAIDTNLGPDFHREVVADREPGPPLADVHKIGAHVFSAELPWVNDRALFVDFPEYVVAIEAPHDSEAGRAVLEAIWRTIPAKPVRYVMITHHHPDHAAGLRPFVAAGATIVTTPGNVEYLTALTSPRRQRAADEPSCSPGLPRFETVHGRATFGQAGQTIEAWEVGSETHHTDEYLIFYLPSEKLLFEGDLVNLPAEEAKPAPANDRAVGLYEAVQSRHLDVQRIVQGWPVRDRVKAIDMNVLAAMLQARREREGRQ